jgi:membrane peptidoglycan carboxypeptidase
MKIPRSVASRRLRRAIGFSALAAVAVVIGAFSLAAARAPSTRDLAAQVSAFDRAHQAVPVSLSAIAASAREAAVATEDERFYQHDGVDVVALFRAVPYDVSHLSLAQGASTIPEQLAKIVYLSGNDHSPWRKTEDVVLGYRLGHIYSHERLLDAYLNVVYLGEGQYGIERASQHYFGRTAKHLSLSQASFLIGLIQAPSLYDPRSASTAARVRQSQVLQSMVRNGYTTEAEASAAIERPLRLASGVRLNPVLHVSFAAPAPFDWVELAFAIALLVAGLILSVLGRLRTQPVVPRALSRSAVPVLLLLGTVIAAHSVQVV